MNVSDLPMPQAMPMSFGSQQACVRGWLHAPPASASNLGIVICNPFGYEAVCVHRTLRTLAEALCARGLPTLRFDYAGTGDSDGGDADGGDADDGRVEAWITSVGDAIDALKRTTGVHSVALVGVRFGATVAALTAARRSDIARLALLAPIVKGRAYLRELRAYQAAMGLAAPPDARPTDAHPSDTSPRARAADLEAAGFLLTAQAVQAIEAIDLEASPPGEACEVLVLERDDAPTHRFADAWQARGVGSTTTRFDGYADMMLNAHLSRVPHAALDRVCDWLVDRSESPLRAVAAADLAACVPATHAELSYVESPRWFGADDRLFAMLTQPATPPAHPPREAVLFLNAGAIHHIGPNRMYVTWARRWAAWGLASARMDIGGLGDSALSGDVGDAVYAPRAVDDAHAATDALVDASIAQRICVVGLCSGAYHALRVAQRASSVTRIVMINPLTFHWAPGMSIDDPTPDSIQQAMRARRHVFSIDAWRRLLHRPMRLGIVMRVMTHRIASVVAMHARDLARLLRVPLERDLARDLVALAQRGVALHFVFSRDDPGRELLRLEAGRALDALRRSGALTIDVIDGANHTFTALWMQQALVDVVERLVLPSPSARGPT